MVYPDLLHVFNLGVGRDAAGSILKKILQTQVVFHANTIDERFREATDSLRSFARANHYGLKMKKLTRKKIVWSGSKYPELQSSGSDTHVVCVWLEHLLLPYSNASPEMGDYCTLLWACNRCLRVLYAGDWFLHIGESFGWDFSANFCTLGLASSEFTLAVLPCAAKATLIYAYSGASSECECQLLQYLDGRRLFT